MYASAINVKNHAAQQHYSKDGFARQHGRYLQGLVSAISHSKMADLGNERAAEYERSLLKTGMQAFPQIHVELHFLSSADLTRACDQTLRQCMY